MLADEKKTLADRLFLVALLALVLATLWAMNTTPPANSDRYDYIGRAWQYTQGHQFSSHVVYPLRLAFPNAESWPPQNLSRPSLWSALLIPLLRTGLDDRSGVILAALCALGTMFMLRHATARSFGEIAGSYAALAFVASFSVVRGLWGGGPELAMALLICGLWSWSPGMHGSAGYLACGSLYGLLPMLHPLGWLFAALCFVARPLRYSHGGSVLVFATALLIGLPGYWSWAGNGGLVQSHAELAKSLTDAGGLGPYRTLIPYDNLDVLRDRFGDVVYLIGSRLKARALGLDDWLAWPLVLLAIWGVRRDPHLALRDAIIGFVAFGFVSAFSPEARLLIPLLPIACAWAGAGAAKLDQRIGYLPLLAIIAAPWFLPMGATKSPVKVAQNAPRHWEPTASEIAAVAGAGRPGSVFVSDSSVLAWRARRPAIFLPDTPATLSQLRKLPPLRTLDVLAFGEGDESRWRRGADAAWDSLLARSDTLRNGEDGGASIYRLRADVAKDEEGDNIPQQPVGPHSTLGPNFVPELLVTVPVPPATRANIRLRPEALDALERMLAAALSEAALTLRVVSGYRDFEYQTGLFERAIERHGADQAWVAAPGESEHQLGTAADLADGALEHVVEQSFGQTAEGRWLADNSHRFGFTITYTDSTALESGISPEPWHVRYFGPTRERR